MSPEKIALHEAGHAVMQWLVGWEDDCKFIQMRRVEGGVIESFMKATPPDPVRYKHEADTVKKRLLVLLAGAATTDDMRAQHNEGDFHDIRGVLAVHFGGLNWNPRRGLEIVDPLPNALLQEANRQCREIVRLSDIQKCTAAVSEALLQAEPDSEGYCRLPMQDVVKLCLRFCDPAIGKQGNWFNWIHGNAADPDANKSGTASLFDWKALPDWGETIAGFIPSALQAEVRRHIAASPDGFKYRDDVYAFEKLFREIGDFDELIDRFTDQFPRHFPFLRMYHCCRPLDTASYYRSGMLVLDRSVADRGFADLYLNNPEFPNVNEADIAASVASMADSYRREGWIYFGLDDRFLVDHCSHYLKYGSEYCQGLAVNLSGLTGYDIKADLVRRGTPTVFCVRMPVERVDKESLQALGRDAFYAWAYGLSHGTSETWEVDFAIETDKPLPPENIINHYLPEGIP